MYTHDVYTQLEQHRVVVRRHSTVDDVMSRMAHIQPSMYVCVRAHWYGFRRRCYCFVYERVYDLCVSFQKSRVDRSSLTSNENMT